MRLKTDDAIADLSVPPKYRYAAPSTLFDGEKPTRKSAKPSPFTSPALATKVPKLVAPFGAGNWRAEDAVTPPDPPKNR